MAENSITAGCLYVVATPIGNLEDITLRALRILSQVDLIAAEDTRHTRRLLSAHNIKSKLISYHEHNENQRAAELKARLDRGESIALVTDAGTPTVSDPGYRFVQAAAAEGLPVVPVPGVSAAITALSASGLATDSFTFIGFPARKKAKRLEQLRSLADCPHTLIFYQSPHRLKGFLRELASAMGDRPAVLARELTKLHEEFLRGPLSHLAARLAERDKIRGECTLLLGPAPEAAPAESDLEAALISALDATDRPLSQVAREVAAAFHLPRKKVYDMALKLKGKRI